MTAAFYLAGFDVRDVTMSDLVSKKVSLSEFRGIAFVGGFSYADVLGSAKVFFFLFSLYSYFSS